MVSLVASKNRGDEVVAVQASFTSLPVEIFAKVIDSGETRLDPLNTIRTFFITSRRIRELTFEALTHLPVLFFRLFYKLVRKDSPEIIDQFLLKNLKATPYTHLEMPFFVGHPEIKITANFLKSMEKVMSLGCKCALISASMELTEEAVKPFDLSRFRRLSFEHCRNLAPTFFVEANYSPELVEIDLTDTKIEKEGFKALLLKCRKLEKIQTHYITTLDSRSLLVADFPETLREFVIENHDFSGVTDEELEKANNGLSQAILALRQARCNQVTAREFLNAGKKVLPKLSVFADIEKIIAGHFPRHPRLKARYCRLLLAASPPDPQTQVDLFRACQKYENLTGGSLKELVDSAESSLYALAALLLAYMVDSDFRLHDNTIRGLFDSLERALEINPTCDFAFAALAYACFGNGKKEQAIECAKRSLMLKPTNELAKAVLMNALEDDASWAYFKELSSLAFHSIEVNKLFEAFIASHAGSLQQIEKIIDEHGKRVGLHDTLLSLKILSHVLHAEKIDEAYLAPYTATLLKQYPDSYFAARYRLAQEANDW